MTTQIVRRNALPPHGLLFLINSKGSFICTISDRIAHTMAFVTPVVEHWLEQEIAQWVGLQKHVTTGFFPLMSTCLRIFTSQVNCGFFNFKTAKWIKQKCNRNLKMATKYKRDGPMPPLNGTAKKPCSKKWYNFRLTLLP